MIDNYLNLEIHIYRNSMHKIRANVSYTFSLEDLNSC